MNKAFMTFAATAIAFSVAAPAIAQTVGAAIAVAPEERTRIKEYVVKEKVAPLTIKEQLRVGGKLPAEVELRTVPTQWGPSYSKYRYVYSNDRVYFVEPSTREVVTVVE